MHLVDSQLEVAVVALNVDPVPLEVIQGETSRGTDLGFPGAQVDMYLKNEIQELYIINKRRSCDIVVAILSGLISGL